MALRYKSARRVKYRVTKDGSGEPTKVSSKVVDPSSLGMDCKANCHGLTFADNTLMIDDSDVQTILDNDGNIIPMDDESYASFVIYKNNNGAIVHSAVKNSDGSFSNNAGTAKTKTVGSALEAARGLIDGKKIAKRSNGFEGNINFFNKTSQDKIINTQLGTVKGGVRIIKGEDIKKFMKELE